MIYLIYMRNFVFYLVVMKIKTNKLCQFATPLDGDTHLKPEVNLLDYLSCFKFACQNIIKLL